MLQATFRHLLPALLLAGPALAQQVPTTTPLDSTRAAYPVIPPPLYLASSRIVLGNSLEIISPNDIQEISVLKEASPHRWQSLTQGGIVFFKLKEGVSLPACSLPSLRRELHVRGPVRYELDGRPVQDPKLQIATAAIDKLAVRPPAPGEAASTVAISLKPYVPKPKNDPPGTIYIRGAAGR